MSHGVKVTLEKDLITDSDLRETSLDQWGDQQYGQMAVDLLNYQRRRSSIKYPSNIFSAAYDCQHLMRSGELSSEDLTSAIKEGKEAVYQAAINAADQAALPFTYLPPKGYRETVLELGVATKPRLIKYLGRRGLIKHGLQGSLGKMFDTCLMAADRIDEPSVDYDNTFEPYMSLTEVIHEAKDAGISHTVQNTILRMVERAVKRQVAHGNDDDREEFIFEGYYEIGGFSTRQKNDQVVINRESLVALTHEWGNKPTPATQFLIDLSQSRLF